LESLGFVIVPKQTSAVRLPLELFGRYGRKEAFGAVGVHYDPQQQHLNVGLPPQCKDGGYFIFITLNKEELDPAHNYADQLFADQFIWVTRRDVTEDHKDYLNLRVPETRVSLFVRTIRLQARTSFMQVSWNIESTLHSKILPVAGRNCAMCGTSRTPFPMLYIRN
jgi:hypothetical protein